MARAFSPSAQRVPEWVVTSSQSSSRSVALPVGQGDAFFLETPEGSVLVDGGKSKEGFPDLFRNTTGRGQADILVCTHNDADHANGFLGFLRVGLGCREIWLPGRWLATLPYVLKPGEQLVAALWQQAHEAAHSSELRTAFDERHATHEPARPVIEVYGDQLAAKRQSQVDSKEEQPSSESSSQGAVGGWPDELIDDLERAAEEEPSDRFSSLRWPVRVWGLRPLPPIPARLFVGALVAAERIRQIALAAFHRGVAVRWFEYDLSSPGGGNSWLEALNAKHLSYVPPAAERELLYFLALTTSNLESLVFWAPSKDRRPGVLFTADSDLKSVKLPTNLSGALVTAPHHGSEANSVAYPAVERWARKVVSWVRSDGRFLSRPGQTYLGVSGRRACTLCRAPEPLPKQAVHFFSRSGNWSRSRGTTVCGCIAKN